MMTALRNCIGDSRTSIGIYNSGKYCLLLQHHKIGEVVGGKGDEAEEGGNRDCVDFVEHSV